MTPDAEQNRRDAKPPITLFCSMSVNDCNPSAGFPCTLSGEPECWWHADATWKLDCASTCGRGQERFDYDGYPSEADSILPSLPAATRQYSFPPNCAIPPRGRARRR